MRRFLTLLGPGLGLGLCLGAPGCLYWGPVDPCGGEDPITDELEFAGCDPVVSSTVTLRAPDESVPFHCDIGGAGSIEWLVSRGVGDSSRIVAAGVSRLELSGSSVTWDSDDGSALLEVHVRSRADDPVPTEQRFWRLRLLEATP